MPDSVLSKVWSVVALFALYCAINAVADVQHSPFLLPLQMEVDKERGESAKDIFWFVLVSLSYFACLYLAKASVIRQPIGRSLQAWPAMFSLELDTRDLLARHYQRFWLTLVMVLPLYACGFLLNQTAHCTIRLRGDKADLAVGWLGHLTTYYFDSQHVAVHGDGKEIAYYTGYQFIIFLAISAAILYQWITVIIELRRRHH